MKRHEITIITEIKPGDSIEILTRPSFWNSAGDPNSKSPMDLVYPLIGKVLSIRSEGHFPGILVSINGIRYGFSWKYTEFYKLYYLNNNIKIL